MEKLPILPPNPEWHHIFKDSFSYTCVGQLQFFFMRSIKSVAFIFSLQQYFMSVLAILFLILQYTLSTYYQMPQIFLLRKTPVVRKEMLDLIFLSYYFLQILPMLVWPRTTPLHLPGWNLFPLPADVLISVLISHRFCPKSSPFPSCVGVYANEVSAELTICKRRRGMNRCNTSYSYLLHVKRCHILYCLTESNKSNI